MKMETLSSQNYFTTKGNVKFLLDIIVWVSHQGNIAGGISPTVHETDMHLIRQVYSALCVNVL